MPTFLADELIQFGTELLMAGGVDSQEADLVARSLVLSNLLGHDSHGVMP
jgi:LDH2 family malate/lactate/ureidoglycolate dehydrogenase